MPVPFYFVDGKVGVGKPLPTSILDVVGDVAVTGTITAGGTPVGSIVLAAVGAVPNANGASASGMTLTLQPADGTHPGVLTSGAQTIGGAKTFSGAISASNLSGTNTGDVSLAAVGSSPNANGATLTAQALNLQPADGTNPGVVTAGTQTIGGAKTFSSAITSSVAGASNAVVIPTTAFLKIGTPTLTDDGGTTLRSSSGLAAGTTLFHGAGNKVTVFGTGTAQIEGTTANAANAVAVVASSSTSYSTNGAKLLSIKNSTSEVAYVTFRGSHGSTYTDISGTPGAGTSDTASGRFAIANGTGSGGITITCAACTTTSIVHLQMEQTGKGVGGAVVVPGNGSFVVTTVNGTGAVTNTSADCKFSYMLFNGN